MKRSNARFLVLHFLVIASGSALILVLGASLGSDASIQAWIPVALGAILAASAVVAWLVRPKWNQG
jgi:hypothetical protein